MKTWMKSLALVFAIGMLPACQNAKMKKVDKDKTTRTGPAAAPNFVSSDPNNVAVRPDITPAPIPQPEVTPATTPPRNAEGRETTPGSVVDATPSTGRSQIRTNHTVRLDAPVAQPNTGDSDYQPVRFLYGGRTRWNPDDCSAAHCQPQEPTPDNPEAPPKDGQCVPVPQPGVITNKLDVVFVVDTSASIDPERTDVISKIDQFTSVLPQVFRKKGVTQQIDTRMTVLLAHGPNTLSIDGKGLSVFGQPFVAPNEAASAAAIIGSRGETPEQIKSILTNRFSTAILEADQYCKSKDTNVLQACLRDKSDAQGEAGLLALEEFLTNKRSQFAGHGGDASQVFPRNDAALMVVFVTNENDVCFDYERYNAEHRDANSAPVYPYSQYLWNAQNDWLNFGKKPTPQIERYLLRGATTESEYLAETKLVEFPASNSSLSALLASDSGASEGFIVRDIYEHKAFINECAAGSKGQYMDVASSLEQIKDWRMDKDFNLPIIMSGILYPKQRHADQAAHEDNAVLRSIIQQGKSIDTPEARTYKWFRDKERGMGYINLIHAFQGKMGNIRSNDFGVKLAEFAKDATVKMIYRVNLPMIDDMTREQLDLSTIRTSSLRVIAVNPDGSRVELEQDPHCASGNPDECDRKDFRLIYQTDRTGYIQLHTEALERKNVYPNSLMEIRFQRR